MMKHYNLTQAEYEILCFAIQNGFDWIVRDESQIIHFFNSKPAKFPDDYGYHNGEWYIPHSKFLKLNSKLFKFIKWEDREPTNANRILDNYKITKEDKK